MLKRYCSFSGWTYICSNICFESLAVLTEKSKRTHLASSLLSSLASQGHEVMLDKAQVTSLFPRLGGQEDCDSWEERHMSVFTESPWPPGLSPLLMGSWSSRNRIFHVHRIGRVSHFSSNSIILPVLLQFPWDGKRSRPSSMALEVRENLEFRKKGNDLGGTSMTAYPASAQWQSTTIFRAGLVPMENSDGQSQEPRSSSCSLGKKGSQAAA